MLTDFRNFSIVEFIKKFASNWLSHCPPHLRHVATLPCEMTDVTNSHFHIKTMHWTSIVTNKMSYCQFMMKFKCKLQRLFEMSPFRTDTDTKSRTPLIDRVVDDALLQTVPHVYRSHQSRESYAAVFWVLLFSSFSREIQQVISYSYNL